MDHGDFTFFASWPSGRARTKMVGPRPTLSIASVATGSASLRRGLGAEPLAATSGTAHGRGSGNLGRSLLRLKAFRLWCPDEKHICYFRILHTQEIEKACM